ncbi:hypothetical protein Tc00.1047053511611.30 [Trypanosoma cruzi]|uniref:Uncharacterized protein n=1 Tax=Trypanosoma cruzi (strain CL Brener) TaxID=353153 RepID=Q4CWA1_TRYCC|nr:hypothetical protein Tc00.1047053511611.30 [Trypanosoma cruzi]EAN84552.1 hypothetical protein Tc00.1047053511611.30 [Trypanosoma cruzi]|eukprot:XP_806403.1 hypothetical protein [Trypanosoma cruzi strain CL Brener]
MCGHTEGQTVERHLNIFLILFLDKICRQFLEQHGSWVLFFCVCFFFFFSFLLFGCSRSRGRLFSKKKYFFVLNKSCVNCRCLGCSAVMSLSGVLVVSAMQLRCTFYFVRSFAFVALFFFFILHCFVFLQAHNNHTHKMHIAVDLNAPFVVHAGSCVWRLFSSVAMRREVEGVKCAPRVPFLRVWCTACDCVELGSVFH